MSNKRTLPRLGARDFDFSICLILSPARWPATKRNHNSCGTLGFLSRRIGSGLEGKPDRERNGRETSDGYRTPAGIVRYHLAADVGKGQGKGQVQQTECQGYKVQYTGVC